MALRSRFSKLQMRHWRVSIAPASSPCSTASSSASMPPLRSNDLAVITKPSRPGVLSVTSLALLVTDSDLHLRDLSDCIAAAEILFGILSRHLDGRGNTTFFQRLVRSYRSFGGCCVCSLHRPASHLILYLEVTLLHCIPGNPPASSTSPKTAQSRAEEIC
ncbi:hypothetical protein B0H14DRAFT_486945 [Mycena olivaceomarginata]|nr:hypothetical protein B0H14DRAFT_486945 [Mycena olivaceomarginata]